MFPEELNVMRGILVLIFNPYHFALKLSVSKSVCQNHHRHYLQRWWQHQHHHSAQDGFGK